MRITWNHHASIDYLSATRLHFNSREACVQIYYALRGSRILSSIFRWSQTETIVLAAIAPEAAVAGTPMPGKV
jgi:hypothetical protein